MSTLQGMEVMDMNMLCKPHNKGPIACVTIFMIITFSFWVSWVDSLGSQSSQSPEQSSYCWTLDGSERSLYLSLPHVPDFVSFGVPVHKWSLLFLPLSTSGLYLISHLITLLSERWESWGKTFQLGYQFSSLHWPFRDHSFWPDQVPP